MTVLGLSDFSRRCYRYYRRVFSLPFPYAGSITRVAKRAVIRARWSLLKTTFRSCFEYGKLRKSRSVRDNAPRFPREDRILVRIAN
jgi:hypothetical protein